MSHAGKALMDVLETYPRDELFQTPVEDLVPIASQVMCTRERRQLKLFGAATSTAASCPASSTCLGTATTPPSASGSRRS